MNCTSFEAFLRCPINQSPTKQTHKFSQALRFRPATSPSCRRHSYDLANLDMTASIIRKPQCSSKSPRFRYKLQQSPAPGFYAHQSFVEEDLKHKKGITINTSERTPIKRERESVSPGPSYYTPKTTQTAPFISMSPRRLSRGPKTAQSGVGPGAYNIDKYEGIAQGSPQQIYSKYNNSGYYRIGQDSRFKPQKTQNGQPGPGSYDPPAVRHNKSQQYSFGSSKRKTQLIRPSCAPGPGAYQQFSQFAERRRQVQSKLQRMAYLAHNHR